MGGREGLPRSLGSVYAGSVVRFLGGFRGVPSRIVATHKGSSYCSGMAVSRDGCTLLVVGGACGSDMLYVYDVRDEADVLSVPHARNRSLPAILEGQVWVACDGFVFVAHWHVGIQVLTPSLDIHSLIDCVGARGVCADERRVFVARSLVAHDFISVVSRDTGARLRGFGRKGSGDGDLSDPCGLCFVSRKRRIAVADSGNDRVSVFSVDGEFVRNVGVGALRQPKSVACSAGGDELVVADFGHRRVVVFSASDELLHIVRCYGQPTSVAIHGSTVYAQAIGSGDSDCIAVE